MCIVTATLNISVYINDYYSLVIISISISYLLLLANIIGLCFIYIYAHLLNFEDDLVSLLEHQYDTAFSRHPYPACWFLFLPSHEYHNLSSTYQHRLFFCGHDLLYLEIHKVYICIYFILYINID